jgi:putative ABC transport system permease protein
VLGGAVAASVLAALGSSNVGQVQVPVGQLAAVAVVAVVAGLVAGLLPARRAARLDVLTAIATE